MFVDRFTPELRERVIDALNHISADCPYPTWIKVGMALSSFGKEGLVLFDQWSSTSSKYPGQQRILKVFKSFRSGKVTVGSIFWISRTYGHEPTAAKEIIGAATNGSSFPAEGLDEASQEAERKQRIARARRIWGDSWSCVDPEEVYTGILLDSATNSWHRGEIRSALHTVRDAAFAYFDRRGLDYRWMPKLRLFLLDNSQRDDLAMKKLGAVGGIAIPMMHGRMVIGLQRVYLTAEGVKLRRMMLGSLGVLNLAPLTDMPLIDVSSAQPRSVLLWGEGFETCAMAVQATGLPACVLFTAGQIVSRSGIYREQAAEATSEQLSRVPVIGLLVDKDLSQTGQKSCQEAEHNLQAAGLSGVCLEPPETVRGTEKGVDWANVGLELGREATGRAIESALSALLPVSAAVLRR
jgi:hypothetical protein